MRRLGLVISSLVCAASFLALNGLAHACPTKPDCGCGHKQAEAANAPAQTDAKGSDHAADKAPACGCGAACGHEQKAKVKKPKAVKQGLLDDRLVRPHRTYDASAGLLI